MKTKGNKINIIFSSFLVIGYIICTYFFSSLASQVSGTLGSLIQILMLVVFGLLLFYATRVGEGRQVRRFSLAVLLLIDLPALYIILASLIAGFPFHDAIAPQTTFSLQGGAVTPSIILMMACVALGYGIPYTFLSGYEMKEEEVEAETSAEETVVEGGLAQELADTEEKAEDIEAAAEDAADAEEEKAEEAVEEAEAEAAAEAAQEETVEKKEEE